MTIRTSFAAAIGCSLLWVAGCGGPETPADQRLDALREDGPSEDQRNAAEAGLAKTIAKEPGLAELVALYGDPSEAPAGGPALPDLLKTALDRNSKIGRAAQEISLADAQHMNAVFGYLPQVSFTFSRDHLNQRVISSDNKVYEKGQTSYPVRTTVASVTQPIYDMSRIFGIRYARNAQSVAEVDYIGAVRDVTYEVFDNYIVANQARDRARALAARQRLFDRQIGSRDTLTDIGLDDDTESASLRSERDSIAAEEALEMARYAAAVSALAELTGTVVREIKPLRFPNGMLRADRRTGEGDAVARGLEDNPAIMSAALAVVGAGLDRHRALAAETMPVVDAYATLENEHRSGSRFGGGSHSDDLTVGVSLTVPLFNSNGRGYVSREKSVELRAATMEYYARRRAVETEIRSTHSRMAELRRAIFRSSESAQQARKALDAERGRVASGQSVDLVVAARELRLNKATERVSYYQAEYLRSWTRLHYLMGADLTKLEL
ncbi:hypothetical protein CCR90_13500 [Rhodovulum sulfidophilum]|uniref:TolC family protein n=1 Tax=Rhodovulum sulfidophilum TaxID=35806 RepID=UPI001914BC42|nr:TolC family protein [Rhodovulum sulfidophilum]MBK5924766.1 hypothetical protein [Rhodovulum sulfidophilum]